jgi:hypothetical protein
MLIKLLAQGAITVSVPDIYTVFMDAVNPFRTIRHFGGKQETMARSTTEGAMKTT